MPVCCIHELMSSVSSTRCSQCEPIGPQGVVRWFSSSAPARSSQPKCARAASTTVGVTMRCTKLERSKSGRLGIVVPWAELVAVIVGVFMLRSAEKATVVVSAIAPWWLLPPHV